MQEQELLRRVYEAEAALYDDNRNYAQAVVSTVLSEVAVYLEEQTGKEQK